MRWLTSVYCSIVSDHTCFFFFLFCWSLTFSVAFSADIINVFILSCPLQLLTAEIQTSDGCLRLICKLPFIRRWTPTDAADDKLNTSERLQSSHHKRSKQSAGPDPGHGGINSKQLHYAAEQGISVITSRWLVVVGTYHRQCWKFTWFFTSCLSFSSQFHTMYQKYITCKNNSSIFMAIFLLLFA